MNEELIDGYLDREKVKTDTAFLEAELGKVIKLFDEANSKRLKVGGADGVKQTTAATEEGVKANSRLAESIKAVTSLVNARFASEAKLVTVTTDYHKQTTKNVAEIAKYNKELKLQNAVDAAANGSIEKATALRAKLYYEQTRLNLGTKEGAERSEVLKARIDSLSTFIKKNSDALTQQKINIGNYGGAVSFLKTQLDEIVKKMDQQKTAGKGNSDVMKQLEKEYQILNNLVGTQTAGFANARAEILANTKALFALSQQGLENTQTFKDLAAATGKLQDDLGDIKARTKALGSDTFVFDSMIQGAQLLAGAWGAAQGAAALFGQENEELQKTFVKLQAIMTIIQGLQAVQNNIQKESAFMLGVQQVKEKALMAIQILRNVILKGQISATAQATAATAAQGVATTGTTIGTRILTVAMIGLRAALIATGIGAIVILLIAAAKAMYDFANSTDTSIKSLDEFAASNDRINASLEFTKTNITNMQRLQLEYLKQKGATDKEIAEKEIFFIKATADANREAVKRKIQDAKDLLKQNGATLSDSIKTAEDAQQAINDISSFLSSSLGKKISDSRKEGLEAGKTLLGEIKDNLKEAEQSDSDAEFRREQAKTKAYETAKAKAKKEADERKQKAKEFAKAEREAQIEIMKLSIQDRINVNKAIMDNDKKSYGDRLRAAAEYAKASQELIDYEKNVVLNDKKSTPAQKQLAIDKATIASRDLKIKAEKEVDDIVQYYFDKENERSTKRMEIWRNEQEKKKEIQRDLLDTGANTQELELRQRFEIASRGKTAAQRLKLETKLQEDIERLHDKTALASLILDRQELDRKRLILTLFKQSTANIDKLISENEIAQSNIRIKNAKREHDEKTKLREEALDLAVEIESQATDIVSALANGNNTREKNRLQDQIDLIEQRKNAEIEAVNASTLSEEQKAARINVINATAQARKEELEARQRKLDLQRAKFEKEMGILQIIVQIGVAIAKQQYHAAALAGAALIKAIATPLPRFFRGKDPGNKYQGWALTNDGGTPEVIKRAQTGKFEISTEKDRVTYLNADDVVYKSVDDWLKKTSVPEQRGARIEAMDSGGAEIVSAIRGQNKLLLQIRDKPVLNMNASNKGLENIWKSAAGSVKYVNDNTNW